MKKVIGIVAEGPIDHMVLKTVINRITGEGLFTGIFSRSRISWENMAMAGKVYIDGAKSMRS
jgi:hypothetical protein